ncbi:MAG: hypothetical protein FD126_1998 [Elusimicrobia bacterium]|nr:MAG: hypothetical protein FD126_1998 [Elusimicrobiota bacterium]
MPGESERAELMARVSSAIQLHNDWKKSKEEESDLRKKLGRGKSEFYQDWQDSLARIEGRESLMRQALSAVTKSVEEAYGVGVMKRTGKVHGGLLNGEIAVWSPIIQEKESLVYKVDRPGKKPVYLSYSENERTLGQMLNDGGVIISYKVLAECVKWGSPARLAEVIAHEAVHFDGLLSKNGLSGYNSTEASAYARSIEVGGMIGLDEERQEEVALLHGRHYNASLTNELGGIAGVPYRALPNSKDYPYQLKSDAYLGDWEAQSKRVGEILRQREELVRRHAGSDQAAVDRSGGVSDACGYPGTSVGGVEIPPIPCPRMIYTPPLISAPVQAAIPPVVVPVVPAPPPFDIWGALKALALQGCTRPGTVTQAQLDVLWPKIFGMVNYPDAGAQLGLTGCQATLLNRVVRWAADYKPGTFQLQTFEYEAGIARGDVRTIESEPPQRPRRDYPMPGSEPCLEGRATCGPVYPRR